MAKISVIIPTYNNSAVVLAAVQSVLSQTTPVAEIIIIDDGSTDETKKVLGPVLDHPTVKYSFQTNGGLPNARNVGIKHSQGDIIAFLDADDIWAPEKVARQLARWQETPLAGVLFGNTRFFQDQRFFHRSSFSLIPPHRGQVLVPLFMSNFVHVSSVMMKREVLDKVGTFDETLRSSEDLDLWLRAAKYFDFDYVDDIVLLYRVQAQSMSRNLLTMANSQLVVHEKIEKLYPELTTMLSRQQRQATYSAIHFDLALAQANRQHWSEAKEHLQQALNNNAKNWQAWMMRLTLIGGSGVYKLFYQLRAMCSGFNRWTGIIER